MLKNGDDAWVREDQHLKEMTEQYFKKLYESVGPRDFQPILQQIPSSVDDNMNQQLTCPVTLEEITTTMHQLGATKAPGPDGLHGFFFRTHWPDVCQEILRETQNFFNTSYLNPDINQTQ